MDQNDIVSLSWDDFDELRDPSTGGNGFSQVVECAISYRGCLGGVLAFGSGATVFESGLLNSATSARAQASAFSFGPIGIFTNFDIHVSPLCVEAAVLQG